MTFGRSAMASLFVLIAFTGCKRMSTDAKEQFAKAHSCPEDRVVIKERADMSPAALLAGPDTATPPDDVKKDPGRLAKWQSDHKADREKLESNYQRSYTIFEASGCGTTLLMACTHGERMGSGGSSSTVVVCQEKPLPGAAP